MHRITTLPALHTLETHTMVMAAVVVAVALLVAFLISLMIPYQGGKDKSYIKRRVSYIIVGVVACLVFYLYNDLIVKTSIMNAGFKNMFVKTNLECLGITAGGYILLGLLIMFSFRRSKFGSILGKCKDK